MALAVGAGGLIAREHDTDASGAPAARLLLAIGAGLLFGWSFVLYVETAHDSGFWPALSGRAAAVVIVVAVALGLGAGLRLPPAERRLAVAAGVLDIGARNGDAARGGPARFLVARRLLVAAWLRCSRSCGRGRCCVSQWRGCKWPGSGVRSVGLVLIAAG